MLPCRLLSGDIHTSSLTSSPCPHAMQGPSEAAVESALELATEEGSEVTTNELMALLAIFQTEHCVASVTIR